MHEWLFLSNAHVLGFKSAGKKWREKVNEGWEIEEHYRTPPK